MEIRRATVDDLPWMRMLYAALAAEQTAMQADPYPAFGGDADLDAFTLGVYRSLDLPAAGIFVAADGNRVVGFLGGEIMTREVGMPRQYGHAHYLYVLPEYRKKGVARALMEHGATWAAEQGVSTVELYGLAADDGWLRRGFRPMMMRYYMPLADFLAGRHLKPATPPVAVAAPPKKRGRSRKTPRRDRMNGSVALET